jgi:hypothetical protein
LLQLWVVAALVLPFSIAVKDSILAAESLSADAQLQANSAQLKPNKEQERLRKLLKTHLDSISMLESQKSPNKGMIDTLKKDAHDVAGLLGIHEAARDAGVDTSDGVDWNQHANTVNGKPVSREQIDKQISSMRERAKTDPQSLLPTDASLRADADDYAFYTQRKVDGPTAGNQRPSWGDAEDLFIALKPFGGMSTATLSDFIQWGTADLALKAKKRDQEERDKASAAAAPHRDKLRQRLFNIQVTPFLDQRETQVDLADTFRLRVPACLLISTPPESGIGVAAYNSNQPWYMTGDNRLEQLLGGAALIAKARERKWILYFPQVHDRCELLFALRGDREALRPSFKDASSHIVNLCVRNLEMVPVFTNGYFQLDALEMNRFDSAALSRSFTAGNNGKEGIPNYFVSREYGVERGEDLPTVPTAELQRCEIVRASANEREVIYRWENKASD